MLRDAGLPIGPGRVLQAVRALAAVDVTRPDEFYWTLHAVFVHRGEQRRVFRTAFRRFWREPQEGEAPFDPMRDTSRIAPPPPEPPPGTRRVGDAIEQAGKPSTTEAHGASAARGDRWSVRIGREGAATPDAEAGKGTGDGEGPGHRMGLAYSSRETLRTKDFAAMSAEELAEARRAVARLRLVLRPVTTRRFRPDPRGDRVDLRGTLRAGLRSGWSHLPLRWRTRRTRPPPLVVLCDISGSMEPYTRILLHFLHALIRRRDRIHTFLFGTRLTNVTRHLRRKDPDVAVDRVAKAVDDWSGGTRIGRSLREFNLRWSRRVLTRGAVVLLITDGLDRDAGEGLEQAMERLHRSSRRLIWLNPLLRWEGFEPRAAGIRAMLPHVDDFRTVHNLESLEELVEALDRRRAPTPPPAPAPAP